MKRTVDPLHMFEHVYAELPSQAQAQRQALVQELALLRENPKDG
jgi:plasmid stabilization system protein ParE